MRKVGTGEQVGGECQVTGGGYCSAGGSGWDRRESQRTSSGQVGNVLISHLQNLQKIYSITFKWEHNLRQIR